MSSDRLEIDKKKIIADAAFAVFAEHGFRKTSMQLIAQKAQMSRPALYLHFQSKEDVFGFLVLSFFKKVEAQIHTLLVPGADPTSLLSDVFDAFDPNGVMAVLLDAEHGDELMTVKNESVQTEIQQIEANMLKGLTNWLLDEAEQDRIICPAPDITAQTILSSYYGLKSPRPSYQVYKARTSQLAQLLGKGLRS